MKVQLKKSETTKRRLGANALLTACFSLGLSAQAWALPNLVGNVPSAPIVTSLDGGKAKMKFSIAINNTGADAATGSIRIKPILVPESTTAAWPEHGGRVLAPIDVTINLAAGASMVVPYEMPLPTVPSGSYYLSAIINSNKSIAETSLIDNVTDLVKIGQLAVAQADAPPALPAGAATLDFVGSTGDSMQKDAGTIKHQFNTYSLSSTQAEPDFGAGRLSGPNNSSDLYARFMFANMKTKKVYTVIYNDVYGRQGFDVTNPEKQWFLATWHNLEKMPNGLYRQHDTYSQSTSFDGIPPGDYKYLILINSHDIPETDPNNNLTVSDIQIRGVTATATLTTSTPDDGDLTQAVQLPELWLVDAPGNAAPQAATFSLLTDYSTLLLSSLAPTGNASWLSETPPASLQLDGDNGSALSLLAQPGTLEQTYQTTLGYSAAAIPAGDVYGNPGPFQGEIPVSYFVRNTANAPDIALSTAVVNLDGTYTDLMGQTQTIKITNPGHSDLQWKAFGLPTWASAEPSEGVVPAGASMDVKLRWDVNNLDQGASYSAQMMIMTNIASGSAGLRSVGINMSLEQVQLAP